MLNEDVYVLDCYDTCYIWVGNRSNDFEKRGAYKKVEQYLAGVQDGRVRDEVGIQEVQAGHEPPDFTVQFFQWEPEVAQRWLDDDPIAKLRAEFEAAEEMAKAAAEKDPFEGFLNPKENVFPYAELKGAFPKGVKGNAKEWYMSDEEFTQVMGMDKAKYGGLKLWK